MVRSRDVPILKENMPWYFLFYQKNMTIFLISQQKHVVGIILTIFWEISTSPNISGISQSVFLQKLKSVIYFPSLSNGRDIRQAPNDNVLW